MTKNAKSILAAVILLAGCVGWLSENAHKKDEACFKNTIREYETNVREFDLALQDRFNLLRSQMLPDQLPQNHNEIAGVPPTLGPTPARTPPIVILPPFGIFDLLAQISCKLAPMPINVKGQILNYPTQPPAPCNSIPYPSGFIPKSDKVVGMSKSVGRVEIRFSDDYAPVVWGTGFMIAPGVVATNCHVVAPLLLLDGNLQLAAPESLVIDFEATGRSPGRGKEFPVSGFLGCSHRKGLDIALLNLCGSTCPPGLPDPLPLMVGQFEDIKKEMSIVIGYADLERFINPDRRAMYDPFVPKYQQDPIYDKFVMIDGIEAIDKCEKGFDIVLDTESTTVGESGAVVIDLHAPIRGGTDMTDPAVVAMHTCCSAYYETDYGKPPEPDLSCARLRRTFHNQAITTSSILADRELCSALRSRGTKVVNQAGTAVPYSCPNR